MPGRLRKSLSEANYASLILEILVVILGILIAFQIDRWTEQRREQNLEYEYLQRLSGDLRFEISNMKRGIAIAESRIEAVRFLESVTQNPSLAAEEPETVLIALEKVSWYSFPKIDGFVYYELQNTGRLSVIRSEALRRVLADYYTRIRGHERIAFERDIQFRYDQAVAGILTTLAGDVAADAPRCFACRQSHRRSRQSGRPAARPEASGWLQPQTGKSPSRPPRRNSRSPRRR